DELVFVRPLAEDLVAALGGQGHHGRATARRPFSVDLVQAVEGHVAAAHHAGVDLGIFREGGAAADRPAVELEGSVGRETLGPTLGVLAVDGVAITGAQLLDRELLSPFLFEHGSALAERKFSHSANAPDSTEVNGTPQGPTPLQRLWRQDLTAKRRGI